ncbi:hypothetical protein G6F43_000964 [Rhizopus delemar]|nr:hypothetical protein G6F43_000964 [Rhizopus delemar]
MAVNVSDSQAIQEKTHAQEDFNNGFQPSIKPAFSFVPSSDPFEGFKKKSVKKQSKQAGTGVSTPSGTTIAPPTSATTAFASASKGSNDQEKKTSKADQKKNNKQSMKRSYHVKSKAKAYQVFAKTLVIKANLNNTCKGATMILKIQKLVSHTAQVIYTGFMFADYFYPYQVKNKQVLATITHSLVYQLFSLFTGQGKKADEEAKNCFDRFCESLPERTNLDEFRGQGYQASASFMAKQYEALVGT